MCSIYWRGWGRVESELSAGEGRKGEVFGVGNLIIGCVGEDLEPCRFGEDSIEWGDVLPMVFLTPGNVALPLIR